MTHSARKLETPRDARLDPRLTADEKTIIERAADACGDDLSSLVRRAAVIEAKRILRAIEGGKAP